MGSGIRLGNLQLIVELLQILLGIFAKTYKQILVTPAASCPLGWLEDPLTNDPSLESKAPLPLFHSELPEDTT